jgi:hypothetical protein
MSFTFKNYFAIDAYSLNELNYEPINKPPSPIKIKKPDCIKKIGVIRCLNCNKRFPDTNIVAEKFCSMDCLSNKLYNTGDLYLEQALY